MKQPVYYKNMASNHFVSENGKRQEINYTSNIMFQILVTRPKPIIFHEHVCGATNSSMSKTNYLPRNVFVAPQVVARLKPNISHECVCGATNSSVSKANYFPRMCLCRHKQQRVQSQLFHTNVFVAPQIVACPKPTIFHECVCVATNSSGSKANYFPRMCLCRHKQQRVQSQLFSTNVFVAP